MIKKRIAGCGVAVLAALVLIAGCAAGKGSPNQVIEGLDSMGKINVVTREEGSGTRGVFAEKVNLENKEKNGNSDRIRSDAQIAMNAEAVMQTVANDKNAIGFVSLGSITDEMEGIKVLAVNDIIPDSQTISKGKYPLTRNFNIAYSGEISAVENDFLRYIMGAGQQVVSENFTAVKKTSTFLSDQSAGTLIISGSSSAAPLMEALVKDYNEKYNKNAVIQVQTTDSTAGLTAAMQGSSDWGMASRELKDYEKELLTYKTIAKDGVGVIVNGSNPVTSLTIDQLTQIFNGTDQNWSDINK